MLKKPKQLKKHKVTWKKAWDACSLYIRTRDNFKCVQCGKGKPEMIVQAGHVIACGGRHSIRFLEDDLFCQCFSCNFKHGVDNYEYFEWYDSRFGKSMRDELHSVKMSSGQLWVKWFNDPLSFGKNDYAGVKEYYELKLKELSDPVRRDFIGLDAIAGKFA